MANAFVVNQVVTTGGAILSLLAEMLVSAGWSYQSSGAGSGTGFSSTGKIFTGTGSGANGWNNTGSWARLRDPNNLREIVIQHDAGTAPQLRCKYSPSARFTGGSPSATVTPSASDEKYVRGAGTDASPLYGTWCAELITGSPTFIFMGGAIGNGFWFSGYNQASSNHYLTTATRTAQLMLDPVQSVAEDPDPCVLFCSSTYGFVFTSQFSGGADTNYTVVPGTTGTTGGWFAVMSTDKSQWLNVVPAAFTVGGYNTTSYGATLVGAVNSGASAVSPSPFSGKSDILPVPYMRVQIAGTIPTQIAGLKGWSTLMRWATNYRQVGELSSDKNWINLGSFWLPWDGTSTTMGI